jgi:hypothetical protein rflaF_12589
MLLKEKTDRVVPRFGESKFIESGTIPKDNIESEVFIMFELKPYTRKNNGVYYNPFQTMDEFERNFFNPSFFETTLEQFKTDIKDDGDSYTLQADLPGFDKKDIHLDLNNDVLTISAERHSEHEDKDKKGKFVRCERSYGTYTRQFDVSNINTDAMKAKYENGVLTLNMPKKSAQLPTAKRVEIE